MRDESFDDLLKKACEAPHGLEKKIRAAIKRDAARQRFVFWRNIVAVAASIVVVGMVFIAFKRDGGVKPEIIAETPAQQMTPIIKQPAQKLTLVGANGQGVDSSIGSEKTLRSVDKIVRHVWGVDDEKTAREILAEYAEADDAFWRFDSDRQLQKCVNELHKSGCRLYSTQYPLPERDREVAFDGHAVQYLFIIVEK